MSDEETLVQQDVVTLPDAEPVPDDDLAALLAKRQHAKPNRLTWVLLTLLVLMIGFIGGAFASQKFGTSSGSSSGFPPAGAFPAAGAFPSGSAAGGFGNATVGTVKLVDGTNLYLTTTNGETVKVKVPESAKVTSQQSIPLSELTIGSNVIVRGDKGTDGTVTATAVSEASLPNSQPTTQGGN